jgi:asparagine N-glycosylation enzyme membrane subunit Stt3
MLINLIAWPIGLGHPSIYLIDSVAAWLPPILAGLTAITVYQLGLVVFKSRLTGLFAAFVVSLVPSEFFHRSMLGFTDHHVLEVYLALNGLLLLILALHKPNYARFLGAFLCLIAYCLNWIGWPLLVFLIFLWFFVDVGLKWKNLKIKITWFAVPVVAFTILLVVLPAVRSLFMAFMGNTFLGFTGTIQEIKPTNLYEYYVLYGISGFVAAGGLILAITKKVHGLFVVWAVFFALAAVFEKRWGYYGVVGIALLAGYAYSWVVSEFVGRDWRPYVCATLCMFLIISTTTFTLGIAKRSNDISPEWQTTCAWLRYNTPEPFEDKDSYYKLNPGDPQYGILTWWDYGHWIIGIGHRVPLCSPTQQENPAVYPFFTAKTEAEANSYLSGLNVKYLILDEYIIGPKYYAIVNKVNGNYDGWEYILKESFVYSLYNNYASTDWKMVHQIGGNKTYMRVTE